MNSRNKGKRGERLWRDELRAQGFIARRGQQFSGSPDSPDVVCDELSWIHFEVKCVQQLNIEAAMEQARRDCGLGKAPIVAHKRNFCPWLVTMEAEQFYRFLSIDVTGKWADPIAAALLDFVHDKFPWMFLEAWERKHLNIRETLGSAEREAGAMVAVIAHRRPEGRWLVTLTAETFFKFLRGTLPPVTNETPEPERKEDSNENQC